MILSSIMVLHAQDIHFSQFYNSPLNLNPALTGVFNGDHRFVANYRSQWNKVPVNYLTFSGTYDTKLNVKKVYNGVLSAGVKLNYDRAGDSRLRMSEIGLIGSYTFPINEANLLTAGFGVDLSNRSFSTTDLRYDDQYDGEIYNPNIQTSDLFAKQSFIFFGLNAGINYHWQSLKNKRSKLDAGLGIHQFNQPKQSFQDQIDVFVSTRFSGYALGTIKLAEKFDLEVDAMYQNQGVYKEFVFGAGLKIYVNNKKGSQFALQPGINLRSNDAIIPYIEFYYEAFKVGLSYDVNTSPFNVATRYFGGPEMSLIYRIINVRPLQSKPCPIF